MFYILENDYLRINVKYSNIMVVIFVEFKYSKWYI